MDKSQLLLTLQQIFSNCESLTVNLWDQRSGFWWFPQSPTKQKPNKYKIQQNKEYQSALPTVSVSLIVWNVPMYILPRCNVSSVSHLTCYLKTNVKNCSLELGLVNWPVTWIWPTACFHKYNLIRPQPLSFIYVALWLLLCLSGSAE